MRCCHVLVAAGTGVPFLSETGTNLVGALSELSANDPSSREQEQEQEQQQPEELAAEEVAAVEYVAAVPSNPLQAAVSTAAAPEGDVEAEQAVPSNLDPGSEPAEELNPLPRSVTLLPAPSLRDSSSSNVVLGAPATCGPAHGVKVRCSVGLCRPGLCRPGIRPGLARSDGTLLPKLAGRVR